MDALGLGGRTDLEVTHNTETNATRSDERSTYFLFFADEPLRTIDGPSRSAKAGLDRRQGVSWPPAGPSTPKLRTSDSVPSTHARNLASLVQLKTTSSIYCQVVGPERPSKHELNHF